MSRRLLYVLVASLLVACGDGEETDFDTIIHGGHIYDGTGMPSYQADIGIIGDRIAAIGNLENTQARRLVDASGMEVAPGFINMLSWGVSSLIIDGKGQSDIRQGVTLEVFGEGMSMGPLNEATREIIERGLTGYAHDAPWTTLGEYLEHLESQGVSPNVASFLGATNVRMHVIGQADRAPTSVELESMQDIVHKAMSEGAMGLASALIYAPGAYATTDELIALAEVVAQYNGMYISHLRSESANLEGAVEELIRIAESANVRAEIYHLKAAGKSNWQKIDRVIELIEEARDRGTRITADMYPYVAGASGLDASMPLWVQEGGYADWVKRLQDPDVRKQVLNEMNSTSTDWENMYQLAGPDGIVFESFRNDDLRQYIGRTLSEVAAVRGTSPAETVIDLVIEDGSRVGVLYYLMSEENVRKIMTQSWVSFGSDAPAQALEGVFLERSVHPRAYGTFARVLSQYVRGKGLMSLEEAIRRFTGLPAENLGIEDRGRIAEGFYADIVIFDSEAIADHATFDSPQQFSTGVEHVFVNGIRVLKDGEHTGAMPGQVVRGPGWLGSSER